MNIYTLLDGKQLTFDSPATGQMIAEKISRSLAEKAIAIKVDGQLKDIYLPVAPDAQVQIITADSVDGLEILRHDTAHILAEAIKELFPETQITIGPVIDNGFFYDIQRDTPISEDDLAAIEQRMHAIVDRKEEIRREEWPRDHAIQHFHDQGELFKAEIIYDLPEDAVISVYRQGQFLDLCRGPHLPHTGKIGHAFKLMKIAGAYWRGNAKNPMLQRIYGTAWATQKELDHYLHMLEEAEKRDHRKLGKALGLFHLQEEAKGGIFWHPKGWALYRTLEDYVRRKLAHDYEEVRTPQLLDRSFWETSGHWDKFRDAMFTCESEDQTLALKPMSCPCHVQIFKQGIRSYRDLPMRMAEFGNCHRNEPSGALHGIMRTRAFIQDDGHIFCTPKQITQETVQFCQLLQEMYKDLGFEDFRVKFSDRPAIRAGEDSVWDQAETALKTAVKASGLPYEINSGEGAFYGPKLEFVLRDAIGRDWQCGTIQVDYVLPERLDATYIGEDGQKHRPVMLHRAVLGSFERFIGILIEHCAGKFPLWLAPTQVVICPITSEIDSYALAIKAELDAKGFRCDVDTRNEKVNLKIRDHSLQKVPVLMIVGKREAEQQQVTIRRLGVETQITLPLATAVAELQQEARLNT